MNWQNCTNARQLEIERRQRRIRNVIVATVIGVVLLKFFCGCASHQSASPTVTRIAEAQAGVTAAQTSVTHAQGLARDTSKEIKGFQTASSRADAKDEVVAQWDAYMKRKHAKP